MFSKKKRVSREKIKRIVSEGQKTYSEIFLIKKLRNECFYNRYSFIVSKKVSKLAIKRNIVKRNIKRILYKFDKDFLINTDTHKKETKNDFVLIINPKIIKYSKENIINELKKKKDFMVE
jgi:ribonuclease P protein component